MIAHKHCYFAKRKQNKTRQYEKQKNRIFQNSL